MADRETIRQQMKADGVEYILAQFIDIHGSPKVKMVPVSSFDDAIVKEFGGAFFECSDSPHSRVHVFHDFARHPHVFS